MSVRGKGRVFRFSDEQYTSMSGYFTKYDQDHDGELNFSELRNLVREVGQYQDGTDLDSNTQTLMKKLNASGSGSLTFNEFLKGYEKMLASAEGDDSLASLDILHVAVPQPKPKVEEKSAADKVKEAAEKVAQAKAAAEKAAKEEEERNQKAAADKAAREEAERKTAAEKAAKEEANRKSAEERKNAAAKKKVSVTLEWNHGGDVVLVGGTFNNWELVPMTHQSGTRWTYTVNDQEPNTLLLYKFHVDGQWAENAEKPTDDNERIEGRVVVNNSVTTPSD